MVKYSILDVNFKATGTWHWTVSSTTVESLIKAPLNSCPGPNWDSQKSLIVAQSKFPKYSEFPNSCPKQIFGIRHQILMISPNSCPEQSAAGDFFGFLIQIQVWVPLPPPPHSLLLTRFEQGERDSGISVDGFHRSIFSGIAVFIHAIWYSIFFQGLLFSFLNLMFAHFSISAEKKRARTQQYLSISNDLSISLS